ncbi:hypothetical protein [Amycolatopsis thailandensis]|uniref:hypothetical protein n=1 Tax=Amycolatopsis thailandensis TaxID=589330 RepID=UPI0011778843|nr:hypothetical protein [Amycolatopsis thailandensis]
MRRPRWDRIVDLVTLGVPAEQQEKMLAFAAGLYCAAARQPHPDHTYRGEVRSPSWAQLPAVSVVTIQQDLIQRAHDVADEDDRPVEVASSIDSTAGDMLPSVVQGDLRDELVRLTAKLEAETRRRVAAESVLDNQVRDWRRLKAENELLRGMKAADDERLRQQFIETTTLRLRNYEVSAEKRAITDFCMNLLETLHPTATADTLRRLIDDQVAAIPQPPRSSGAAIEFLRHSQTERATGRARLVKNEAERRRNNAAARDLADRLSKFYSS